MGSIQLGITGDPTASNEVSTDGITDFPCSDEGDWSRLSVAVIAYEYIFSGLSQIVIPHLNRW